MTKKFALVFLPLSLSLFGQQTKTYNYIGPPLMIYTDAANIATVATIQVVDAFQVQSVSIKVNVAYTPVGDINLYAYAPDGTRTKLVERNCGSNGTLVDISFADSGSSKYADFCPAEAGRGPFQGNEPLSNFKEKYSAGLWYLAVENNGSSTTGWLNGWSISLTYNAPPATPTIADVVNRGGLKAGAIAPGSDVLIYGSTLGPATITFAPAGQAPPTTLGGVQVLVNGTAVPLKAVSSVGIDALMPYSLTPGSTATIQVLYQTSGNTISRPVQATAPGLYVNGMVGTPGDPSTWNVVKAADASYKVLNASNPAVQDSVVIVYAAGLGVTDPVLPAGQIPPNAPLYKTVGSTVASIGGMPAPVEYSGLAPGYPGVYQLNIRVPKGLAPGSQKILIWNGGGVSQDNLTIPVKGQ